MKVAPGIRSPRGPGASAGKPAGSGALGPEPLQRPRAGTGHPSHGGPREPRGGPWRPGLRLLRAGTHVPEPGGRRGAGGPWSGSPARPAKTEEVRATGRGDNALRVATTGSPAHAVPGTEPEPDRVGTPAPGLVALTEEPLLLPSPSI